MAIKIKFTALTISPIVAQFKPEGEANKLSFDLHLFWRALLPSSSLPLFLSLSLSVSYALPLLLNGTEMPKKKKASTQKQIRNPRNLWSVSVSIGCVSVSYLPTRRLQSAVDSRHSTESKEKRVKLINTHSHTLAHTQLSVFGLFLAMSGFSFLALFGWANERAATRTLLQFDTFLWALSASSAYTRLSRL